MDEWEKMYLKKLDGSIEKLELKFDNTMRDVDKKLTSLLNYKWKVVGFSSATILFGSALMHYLGKYIQ